MPRRPVVDVDEVARSLAVPGSRRAVLRALGVAWLGTLFASLSDPGAVAAAKRSRKRRKKPVRCQKPGAVCNRRKPCCKGTRCARGTCQCPAGKKRCGAKCVPKGACCPASGDQCGNTFPVTCPPGTKECNSHCIPVDGCCDYSDCTGECDRGNCDTASHTCSPAWGRSCGPDGLGRCNSDRICAQACETDADCPPIPGEPTSATEFCMQPTCEVSACIIGTKPKGTRVDSKFQSTKSCEVRICDAGDHNRYSLSTDQDLMDATLPRHENDCLAWTCRFASTPADEPVPRPAGTPCGPDGEGRVCDGSGTCIEG